MIAAKAFDPVLGVDVHIIQPPGPVPPVPVPHPFVGMLIDPFDFAPIIGSTVSVNGLPRATAGTGGQCLPPHIPIGGAFVKPPANECDIFMGSSTVLADGEPLSFLGMPALSCHCIGMPPVVRAKKKRRVKSLVNPTSVVLAIPMGAPVLVGGPPTVSMMALGMRAGMAALGKTFKKLRKVQKASRRMKAASDKVHDAARRAMNKLGVPPSVQNRVHRAVCTVTGHPVDVATGKVFTEALDFELPGPIPIRWARVWYSCSSYAGPLGRGWHHGYDLALVQGDGVVALRMPDGRAVWWPVPEVGEVVNRAERLALVRRERELAVFDLNQRLWFRFGPPGPDGVQKLARIEDGSNNRVAFVYDADGRLSRIVDSVDRELVVRWNEAGFVDSVLLPDPDGQNRPVIGARYRYRGDLLTAAGDALGVTATYEYTDGLLTRESDGAGFSFHFRYQRDGALARCVETWGDGPVIRRRLAYDPIAGITRQVDARGRRTTYVWSEAGLVEEIQDARGGVTRFRYDEDGYLLARTDPLGHTTSFEYDGRGNRTAIVDASGATTSITYDAADLPVLLVDAAGFEWRRGYTDAGHLRETVDPLGRTWRYERDERGRLTAATSPAGGVARFRNGPTGAVVEFQDYTGRLHRCSHDGWGRPTARVDAAGGRTQDRYDLRGRLLEMVLPSREVYRYEYDARGCVTRYLESGGREVRYRYGGYEQLLEVAEADGAVTRYAYDDEARLVRMEDGAGRVWRWAYDEVGNVVEEHRPDSGVTRYAYDAANRLVEVENARGERIVYTRDPVGRVLTRSAGGVTERFTYDARGNLIVAEGAGGAVELEYDEVGRVIAERSPVGAVRSTYDVLGNRVTRSTPGGDIQYAYNPGSELTGIALPDASALALERGPMGDATLIQWSRGIEIRRDFDVLGRRTGQRVEGAGGRLLAAQRAAYVPLAEPVRLEDTRFGGVEVAYDARGRVRAAKWDDGEAELCSHDQGLFLRDIVRFSPQGRPLEQPRLERDGSGRATRRTGPDGGCAFEYDAFGRLARAVLEDGSFEVYVYDALGRRLERVSADGARTRYLWDGVHLAEAVDGDRTVYVWDDDEAPVVMHRAGTSYLVETDHLGRPRGTYGSSGDAAAWAADYYVYGAIRREGDASADPLLRCPGQQHDRATGLYYNLQRYYDPSVGQYLTPDPVGVLDGGLGWDYTPNPLAWIDPLGLMIVYRNLRPDEDPTQGLVARRPGRNMTPAGHVMNGSKPTFKGSQYISTTTDPDVAAQWRQPGQRTVAIDTDLLERDAANNKSIVDLTTPEKASAAGLRGRPARYAVASREVLLEGRVPPAAIRQVCP